MNAAMTQETPDLAIRAQPPSPKRLSRKVLLGAAALVAAIIAASLIVGLSVTPREPRAAQARTGAASGAPETIQLAPAHYETSDLAIERGAGDGLDAPEDEFWAEQAPTQSARRALSAPGASDEAADPQPAVSAPILFADAAQAQEGRNEARLEAQLTPPRSRYEILAGAIIPAVLATELNSDVPGQVIAQVSAPVYDSVTGAHLLIPQGARLIGRYDAGVRYGDQRIALVWTRLILPDGWSINLEGMQGGDAQGAAGVSDRTDRRLDRLAAMIGLSAIVSVVANNAEDDGDEAGSFSQSVGDAAAQEAARSGGRIIEREMSVRPTLRIRAGAPVRVLVTRDIQLRPYRARTHGE